MALRPLVLGRLRPHGDDKIHSYLAWAQMIVTAVILGGIGSLLGAFVGSFVIGFVYTFGTALFPELAYIILFLPMVIILAIRPRGLFGKISA